MAQKARLRQNRFGTVVNVTSSKQEVELAEAMIEASEAITAKHVESSSAPPPGRRVLRVLATVTWSVLDEAAEQSLIRRADYGT